MTVVVEQLRQPKVQALAPQFNEETLVKLRGMRREQRLKWHERRVRRDSKIFAIIDVLRQSHVVNDDKIVENLKRIKNSIQVVENYIKVKQLPEFQQLLVKQGELKKLIMQCSLRRLPYMFDIETNVSIICDYLRTEALYLDAMTLIEQQIEKICNSYSISGYPFFMAGCLVRNVWGVASRQLLEKIGKV